MQPHRSWKKPNYFIQVSFYTSSIPLKSSLWHQQVTETWMDLDLLQRWGWGKKACLNKFLRKYIKRRSPLHLQLCAVCEHVCISGVQQAVGLLAMRLRGFLFVYSVFRCYSLLRKLWDWSQLQKISFVFSVVPDSDIRWELLFRKNVPLRGDTIIIGTYILFSNTGVTLWH